MKRLFLFVLISHVIITVTFVYAENVTPNPKILIDEMSVATNQLNYDGIFIYRHDKQIDTMRIIHKKNHNGDIYERLISLTGNAREIIREKDQVKYFFPENKIAIVEKNRLGQLISSYMPDPIQSISEFYIFDIVGDGRVAGLDTWIVNIKPVDKYRYGYQLWIDKKSKLLLKSKLKNFQGVTLEYIMFTQIHILENISDLLLKPSFSGRNFTWINNIINTANYENNSERKWVASWMPGGFSMSEYSKDPMSTSKIPVEHFIYTDGLASISIFVEKLSKQHKKINSGTTNFGGINTYSTLSDGYQITAVGEVPQATVKLIADSVQSSH